MSREIVRGREVSELCRVAQSRILDDGALARVDAIECEVAISLEDIGDVTENIDACALPLEGMGVAIDRCSLKFVRLARKGEGERSVGTLLAVHVGRDEGQMLQEQRQTRK